MPILARSVFFCSLLLGFVVLFSGCSLFDFGSDRELGSFRYGTPKVDVAQGATLLSDGNFLVYGFAEGVGGAGDWTNAFPFLLFMRSDGTVADTVVYRHIRYGVVIGAAPFGGGVAVLIDSVLRVTGSEPHTKRVYLLESDYSLGAVILSTADFASPPLHLIPTSDGGFLVRMLPKQITADDLMKVDAAGEVAWTYHMPDVQDVTSVAETEDGDILVLGVRVGDQFDVVRLGSGGEVQWQKTYTNDY